MHNRIMEILVFLMDHINAGDPQEYAGDRLNRELVKCGYTKQEIETAFNWLYEHIKLDAAGVQSPQVLQVQAPSPASHRVLHPREQAHITPAAFGYLLQLRHLNQITAKEMDVIIERALTSDPKPVTLAAIKSIVRTELLKGGLREDGRLRLPEECLSGETHRNNN